jgi:CDP-paratose 2-epimerase
LLGEFNSPILPAMANRLSRILVTGGAGFVGSTIAIACKRRWPSADVVALDNLKRRGSELIVPRLREQGIQYLHGDIRCAADFPPEEFDVLVECSAEPSILAGYGTSPAYLLDTNLAGALHCLEFCRMRCQKLVFISTSRVYSIPALRGLQLSESASRFELLDQTLPGAGLNGISEDFPTTGPRSLYGATKLAAEILLEEYCHAYALQAVINRCGVLAGPWQMGKADQGIFTFWLASHYFQRALRYIGFGGEGKQVRDLLHGEDLAELVCEQLADWESWKGLTLNVGGGRAMSLSLCETTELCRELTGNRVEISGEQKNRPMDVPLYITDYRRLAARTNWRPRRTAREILADTYAWICEHHSALKDIL